MSFLSLHEERGGYKELIKNVSLKIVVEQVVALLQRGHWLGS
jgi:hypothetical protein